MNGTLTNKPASFINAQSSTPRPPFLVPPFRTLTDGELDSIWLAVRRQAQRDAAAYDDLAEERTLDDLAENAIQAALRLELGAAPRLAAAQWRRLFFEYLDALLSHVPR